METALISKSTTQKTCLPSVLLQLQQKHGITPKHTHTHKTRAYFFSLCFFSLIFSFPFSFVFCILKPTNALSLSLSSSSSSSSSLSRLRLLVGLSDSLLKPEGDRRAQLAGNSLYIRRNLHSFRLGLLIPFLFVFSLDFFPFFLTSKRIFFLCW